MTTKLNWRLSKLPTPDELRELVKDKIITHEEAREILFSEKTDERDEESFKEEIKFLRALVEKLSNGNTTKIVEYIYSKPYNYGWYQPYVTWCSSPALTSGMTGGSNFTYTTMSNGALSAIGDGLSALGDSFSQIKTF